MEELKMTEKISLNLTLEELEIIDKYIELNDDTRQLFDKIRKAYPKSPVEVAYKRVFGDYPPTTPSVSNFEDNRWIDFQSGYSCGYGDGLENSNNFAISKKIIDKPKEKQSKTLTDIVYDWWINVFTIHSDGDVFTTHSNRGMETSIEDLVDQVEQWLPKPQSAAGSQNVDVEFLVDGFNDCLKKIKGKLR